MVDVAVVAVVAEVAAERAAREVGEAVMVAGGTEVVARSIPNSHCRPCTGTLPPTSWSAEHTKIGTGLAVRWMVRNWLMAAEAARMTVVWDSMPELAEVAKVEQVMGTTVEVAEAVVAAGKVAGERAVVEEAMEMAVMEVVVAMET